MGLDTVELVMAFEDEFGVSIKDEDAEKMITPGNVADYVFSQVRTSKPSTTCSKPPSVKREGLCDSRSCAPCFS